MRYCCCILGCSSTTNDGVKLHEFPFDNQSLLPVWIMATNRTEWLPVIQSRICDKHFSIDDYEGGDKSNKLKPNACPMFNTPNNNVEDSITITDSSDSSCYEISSTSDVTNVPDIDSDEFPDTPNTSDMKQSDTSDDSTINSLFDSNSDEATGLDDEFLSSHSEHGFDVENIDVDQPSQEFDTISLSSSSTNFETTDQIINERCAVVFCNKKVRENFDRLFFIDFPKNKSIRNIWWTLCGRQEKFDPSFKVCSIHFDVQDFIIIRREGIHYQQPILKTNNIVPTIYLLPHEYNTFKKKQNLNNKNRKRTSNNLTEIIKCTVKGCKKTFLNDGKRTLFFKFPLKNKCLLKDWVNSIGLPNWQPSESDRLCSDHFENYFIVKIKDTYELNKYAVPSIKPKKPFFINSGDLNNKNKNSIFNHSHDSSFNCLEFIKLDSNTLMVKDRKRKKVEDKKSDLLDPLQNNIETHQPKAKKNAPAETTIQMKTEDKSVVQDDRSKPGLVSTSNLNNLKNRIEVDPKVNTNSVSPKPWCTSKGTKKSKVESTDNIVLKGKRTSNNLTEIIKCTVKGCKKTFLNDGKRTLFFKFPLKNKCLLKDWVNSIGLPNWQPSESDRLCSDHFENYFIVKIKDTYELNKYAVPSIKPKKPFFINSGDLNNKNKNSIFNHSHDSSFNCLEFIKLDSNTLMVKDRKRKKVEDKKSDLLDPLQNNIETHQPKAKKNAPAETTIQMKTEDKSVVQDDRSKPGLVSTSNLNNLKNRIEVDPKVNTNSVSPKPWCTSKGTKKSKVESTDNIVLKGKRTSNNLTEIIKCTVKGCKKTFLNDGKRTLFFKFPLKNKCLLKDWVNSIGLPNWQPSESDRLCSDHFENYFIVKIKDTYELNKYAVPSIKPKKPFFINSGDLNNKNKNSIFNHSHDSSFNCLEFIKLDSNTLMVKDRKRKKVEDKKSDLLDPLQNNIETHQPKAKKNAPAETTIQMKTEDKSVVQDDRSKPGLVSTSNLNNLKNRIEVDPKVNTNSVSPKPWCTSKGTKKSKVESTDNIVLKGTNLIPVSKNNGNERDYVYLDMLNGDEFKNLLSFEKKTTPKYAKKKIPELIEKIQPKGIPESILNNPYLTECYGEILPPWCSPGCQLKCYYSIPGPQRTEIYKEFQKLTSITEQNCKIVELVKLRTIKKVDSTFESIPSYCFMMNKATVNVCRTFFMNTLGITEQRLNAVLMPVNYSWFSNKDAVLRANLQKSARVINKSSNTTDFVKESLKLLEKDYNLHEPESDTEVSLDNVPADEYEKVFVYMKGVPRVLSSYQKPGDTEKQFFETTICFEYMYKMYSENYIKNKTAPPYSKRQFKKIYNQYMKTFLKMV